MYIRRRTTNEGVGGRLKRTNRKSKSNDSSHFLLGTPLKLLLIWFTILALDFLTGFRVELFYSCWMFSCTMLDTFRFQGLAFALYFALIALLSDLLCYVLLPTTLVYLFGSSLIWIQLVWHTDRGLCGSTFVLCFLFIYVEIAVRWRSAKFLPWGFDIGRPFAAHCVGYQAVTLGFVLQNMITHHLRLRKQRSVEAQNLSFFALLEDALPKDIRQYFKSDECPSKTKRSSPPLPSIDLCPALTNTANGSVRHNRLPNGSKDRHLPNSATPSGRKSQLNYKQPALPSSAHTSIISSDPVHKKDSLTESNAHDKLDHVSALTNDASPDRSTTSDIIPLNLPLCTIPSTSSLSSVTRTTSYSHKVGTTEADAVKSSSQPECSSPPDKSSATTDSAFSNGGTQHRSSAGSGGTSGAGNSGGGGGKQGPNPNLKGANKDEYTLKLEAELKELKAELQSLRGLEIDLRAQVQQLTATERTYRAETSQAQQEYETLQSKLDQLTQRTETDRTNLELTEKRLSEERKQRVSLEQRLASQQQSKRNAASSKEHNIPPSKEINPPNKTSKSINSQLTHVPNSTVSRPATSPLTITTAASSTSTPVCTVGDSCAVRIRELESELRSLNRELSVKDLQLATLKESRSAALATTTTDLTDRTSCNAQQHHPSGQTADVMTGLALVEDRRAELLSKLARLQDENDRMSNTLRDEDKMKQELMTAYHSSLKEITELNASLTKKEYQIVELNMRLETLTSQLYDHVNTISQPSNKYNSPTETRSMLLDNNELGEHAMGGGFASYLSLCDSTKPSATPSSNRCFKNPMMLMDDPRLPDGCGCQLTYSSSNGSVQSSCVSNATGLYKHSSASSALRLLDPLASMNGSHGSVFTRHSDAPHHQIGSPVDHPSYPRQSSSSYTFTSTHTNTSSPTFFDSLYHPPASTMNMQRSQNFFKPLYVSPNMGGYSESVTRPLPVGSAAPNSSPPPHVLPPPGLLHSSLSPSLLPPTSASISRDPTCFPSSLTTTSAFDILINEPPSAPNPTSCSLDATMQINSSTMSSFMNYLSSVDSTPPSISMFSSPPPHRGFSSNPRSQSIIASQLSNNFLNVRANDTGLRQQQHTDQDMIELAALEASLLQTNGVRDSNHQITSMLHPSTAVGEHMRINNIDGSLNEPE